MGAKRAKELIERSTDVGEFGEKDVRGAYSSPLNIAGEMIDLDKTPPLSENDKAPEPAKRS